MRISLIHPSRGRAKKAHDACMNWLDKSSGETDIEYILSVDFDDPQLLNYISWGEAVIFVNNNISVVEATNRAAEKTAGDILVYLSDDFDCPDNWDQLIIDEFKKYTGPALIKVHDCLQNFNVAVLTIPMMNRELYNRLGYFWHPGYKSMFCDEHLYWRTRKLGALRYAPQLKFEHKHVSVGKSQDDETYRRSAANWDQGKALFAQHKAAGFPV